MLAQSIAVVHAPAASRIGARQPAAHVRPAAPRRTRRRPLVVVGWLVNRRAEQRYCPEFDVEVPGSQNIKVKVNFTAGTACLCLGTAPAIMAAACTAAWARLQQLQTGYVVVS